MSNTVLIIPSRLKAKRLPNKPLKLINKKEMILHVYNSAKKIGLGDVLVATPDKGIFDLIKKNGGEAFMSMQKHETGTDRVFEAFKEHYKEKPNIIINLQGDMPFIDVSAVIKLGKYLQKGFCEIATLASKIKNSNENENENVVKVITKEKIENTEISEATDFRRTKVNQSNEFAYHHIGVYAFTKKALTNYVNLKRSKLELERKLEQMRALENKIKIHVVYTTSSPLSVDTEADLEEIKNIMEKNNV